MAIEVVKLDKAPDDDINYVVADFVNWAALVGDPLTSAVVTVESGVGLTLGAFIASGTRIIANLSAGTAGVTYRVKAVGTTGSGRKYTGFADVAVFEPVGLVSLDKAPNDDIIYTVADFEDWDALDSDLLASATVVAVSGGAVLQIGPPTVNGKKVTARLWSGTKGVTYQLKTIGESVAGRKYTGFLDVIVDEPALPA